MKAIRENVTTDDASLPAVGTGQALGSRFKRVTFYPTAEATFTILWAMDGAYKKATPITTGNPFIVEVPNCADVNCELTDVTESTSLYVE